MEDPTEDEGMFTFLGNLDRTHGHEVRRLNYQKPQKPHVDSGFDVPEPPPHENQLAHEGPCFPVIDDLPGFQLVRT